MRPLLDTFFEFIQKRQLVAKAISLLLALIAWIYVNNTKIGKVRFKIPIEIVNKPTNLIISKMSSKTVYVKLVGKKEDLKNIKNIRAKINLKQPKIGKKRYYINVLKAQIPDSIDISLSEKYVEVTLEREIQKRVRVVPKIVGNLKKNYVIGKYQVSPEYVLISGPKSKINKIQYLNTEKVSILNSTSNILREVEIDRKKLENITISEANIKINIPIYSYKDLYSLEIPIKLKNTINGLTYLLDNNKVRIYFKVPKEYNNTNDNTTLLNMLNTRTVDVSLDVANINIDKIKKNKVTYIDKIMPIKVTISQYAGFFEIISTIPNKIKITIMKK